MRAARSTVQTVRTSAARAGSRSQRSQAAAESGCLIEINADPHRLDLDWVHCKRARAMGVTLVINPDAHSTGGLANYHFGVDVARRGWLEKQHVFNTQGAAPG